MSEKTKAYLYKFQFTTLSKWKGGTDGAVYLQVGDQKPTISVPPVGQLIVTSLDSLPDGSNNSLLVDVSGPPIPINIHPAIGMEAVCLRIDTPGAPGDSSFEQRDTDICYFAFQFELPANASIRMLVIGSGLDSWSYRLKVFSVGTKALSLVLDSGDKTTKATSPVLAKKPTHAITSLASCHVDKKTGQIVTLGADNLPDFLKISEITV